MLKRATVQANLEMLALYDTRNGEALQTLVSQDTQLTPFSVEILQAAQKATLKVLKEQSSQDATFTQIYQQWDQFRQRIRSCNDINE